MGPITEYNLGNEFQQNAIGLQIDEGYIPFK